MRRSFLVTAAGCLLLAFLAWGFVGRSTVPDVPLIPIERFLEMKRGGLVQEVWIEGDMLLVRDRSGLVRVLLPLTFHGSPDIERQLLESLGVARGGRG